jgi:hypothetical protein
VWVWGGSGQSVLVLVLVFDDFVFVVGRDSFEGFVGGGGLREGAVGV